ncbi:DUF5675 family protein [Soonwooa purpurea]
MAPTTHYRLLKYWELNMKVMELQLLRTYMSKGTNGRLYHDGRELCKCIELGWHKNAKQRSCVPEGEYRLSKRYSSRHGWHFQLMDVPGRSLILVHPANCAERELLGCIAPVTGHTGEGRGYSSRLAMQKLKDLLFPIMDQGHIVKLLISS